MKKVMKIICRMTTWIMIASEKFRSYVISMRREEEAVLKTSARHLIFCRLAKVKADVFPDIDIWLNVYACRHMWNIIGVHLHTPLTSSSLIFCFIHVFFYLPRRSTRKSTTTVLLMNLRESTQEKWSFNRNLSNFTTDKAWHSPKMGKSNSKNFHCHFQSSYEKLIKT